MALSGLGGREYHDCTPRECGLMRDCEWQYAVCIFVDRDEPLWINGFRVYLALILAYLKYRLLDQTQPSPSLLLVPLTLGQPVFLSTE